MQLLLVAHVADLLEAEIGCSLGDRLFNLMVLGPLAVNELMSSELNTLSGGELQRVAITLCLGKPAAVYLLDEPSAGLDCEQRLVVTNVIQRWVGNNLGEFDRAAIVVEHDMLMASSLCSSIVHYTGTPGVSCTAHAPLPAVQGLDNFLGVLNVTVREDLATGRPRLNKRGCTKDREQRRAGHYYLSRAESSP